MTPRLNLICIFENSRNIGRYLKITLVRPINFQMSVFTDSPDLEIQQFIPKNVVHVGHVIGIFGPGESGKSTVTENICQAITSKVDYFIVIDPGPTRSSYPQKSLILREYNADFMDRMLRSQQEAWRQTNAWLSKSPSERRDLPPKKGLNVCVVMANVNYSKAAYLHRLLLNGRHHHMTVIIECQSPLDLKPVCRGQLDYAICSTGYERTHKIHVHRNMFGHIQTFQEFNEILEYLRNRGKYYWMCAVYCGQPSIGWFQSEYHQEEPAPPQPPKPPKRKRTIRLVDAPSTNPKKSK